MKKGRPPMIYCTGKSPNQVTLDLVKVEVTMTKEQKKYCQEMKKQYDFNASKFLREKMREWYETRFRDNDLSIFPPIFM